MRSRCLRVGACAAGAACCFALAFVIRNAVLADGLLMVAVTGLALGSVAVQVRVGVRALRARSGVVRPMLVTTASLCAGAIPPLFVVLGLGDLFGQFDRIRAFQFGRPWTSGVRFALAVTSQLVGALAVTAGLVIVVVVLLQLQPRRRRLAS